MITGDRKAYLKAKEKFQKEQIKESKEKFNKYNTVLTSTMKGGKPKKNLQFGTAEYTKPKIL